MIEAIRRLLPGGARSPRKSIAAGGAVRLDLQTRSHDFEIRGSHHYDAARTTDNNARHWSYAQEITAAQAHSPELRRILRSRARYEVANNPIARGMIAGLAGDTVGVGPRLQIRTGDASVDAAVEALWRRWSDEIELPEKLYTAEFAQVETGEVFVRQYRDTALRSVPLGVGLIEADRVTAGLAGLLADAGDGIEYDSQTGRPIRYNVLRHLPGRFEVDVRSDWASADTITHLFKCSRPGQLRGVTEIASALTVFAEMRSYQRAVLKSAEVGASQALVIESNGPADDDTDEVEPLDVVDLEHSMATTLPKGWTLRGFSATQPTMQHSAYMRSLIVYAARALGVPANIALGDSSGFNYASGRLDYQSYDLMLATRRRRLERLLDRLLEAFLLYASGSEGSPVTPAVAHSARTVRHSWLWRHRGHVDPLKEANAAQVRIGMGVSSLAHECGLLGIDWEEVLDQKQREREAATSRGLSIPGVNVSSEAPRDDDEAEPGEEPKRPEPEAD